MLIKDWKIGGDWETFLRDKNTKEYVSAEGIAQGTKKQPFNFDKTDKFACTSLDNLSMEFNFAPATTASDFYHGIEKALRYIEKHIPENLEYTADPAVRFDEKYLQTDNAKLLGCEMDFNIWTGRPNPRPKTKGNNLRSCGAHITLGYENPNKILNAQWIKAMDLFVGIPSVIQEPDNERKALYGSAGCYRNTNFGVEYRSTSNYLLKDKELIMWAFDNTTKAIEFVNDGKVILLEEEADIIIAAINNNDKIMAKYMIDKYRIPMLMAA